MIKSLVAKRVRQVGVRPSASPPGEPWQGVLAFVGLIVFLDRFSSRLHIIPLAGLIYLAAVVYLACWAGLRAALAACALLVTYAWLIYHYPFSDFAKDPSRATTAIVSTAIMYPLFAVIAASVQSRLRNAATREFDARAAADSESEQRKIAEAELWASEEMRRLIIDSSVDAVIGMSEEGVITMWNPNAQKLFGWTREEAIGSLASARLAPAPRAARTPGATNFFEANDVPVLHEQVELLAQTKSGKEIAVEMYIADQKTAKGSIYILFVRDISDRKRAEQAIQELNASLEARVAERTKQLQAANEELVGFTYSVSHDLRAPLRAIVANSRLVCDEAKDLLRSETFERLLRLENNALKMAQLIDNLLQYARIGKVELQRKDIDLSAMATEIAQELRERGEGEVAVQTGLATQGDPEMIRMVLFNLMENAWKYVESGKQPSIVVGRQEDGVFFVQDHGIGFDMRYVDKIWLPFERLHRDTEYPGTGIGLANSKRIIERHGGKIWVASEPGAGTTMYFDVARRRGLDDPTQSGASGGYASLG